ncbi:Fc.00g097770.m01.CDS01 [Cosmosporella sp. VM-42]
MAMTSNIRLGMEHDLPPKGTVGHEWFMNIAPLIDDYKTPTATPLSKWFSCFADSIWKVTPTDTFRSPAFLETFRQHMPNIAPSTSGVGPGGSSLVVLAGELEHEN